MIIHTTMFYKNILYVLLIAFLTGCQSNQQLVQSTDEITTSETHIVDTYQLKSGYVNPLVDPVFEKKTEFVPQKHLIMYQKVDREEHIGYHRIDFPLFEI